MLVFGILTDIVIIIAILVHRLFFLCVCTHSCSTYSILVVRIHLSYYLLEIFNHSCDYDIHISGSGIGYGIVQILQLMWFMWFLTWLRLPKYWSRFSRTASSSLSAGPIFSLLSLASSDSASTSSTALSDVALRYLHELFDP